ncbi:unnamed protein product [Caenorhabditis bovis]|uniref:T20D4.11-like domain-containing protein n=1 Tax=Caenorhabditis bovis TaxID=2654633 RepID=A0A8S1E779_9PELO|nr:unnamed protein product [Caenorhabditis bovis]
MFKLLIGAALVLATVAAPNCSAEDNKLLDKCNATMELFQKEWDKYNEEDSEYDAEVMKKLFAKCEDAVECLKPGNCPFITETIRVYNENCLVANIMSGVLFQCSQKLDNLVKPDNLCDGIFSIDKYSMPPKERCDFIAERRSCILQYYEDVCGPEVRQELDV